jgi:hypothetical protein
VIILNNSHRCQYELPKWLLEEPIADNAEDISLVYGRGFRDRPKVDYDDGLTDKQWEKKLIEYDEGSSPPSTPTTGSVKRKRSKSYKQNEEEFNDSFDDEVPTPKRKSSGTFPSPSSPSIVISESSPLPPLPHFYAHSNFKKIKINAVAPQPSTPAQRTRGTTKQKTPSSSAKRVKKMASKQPEDADQARLKGLMDTLWETLRKAADDEGRQYSALFFRLPSKKAYQSS